MAKKLSINCAICDARKAQEEHYAEYEDISINASTILVNAAGKALLHKLPFTLNCSDVMELEGDVEVRTINGAGEIKAGDAVAAKPYYLVVNGTLTIEAGTERQLEQCAGILVNGALTCPQSVFAQLKSVKVNGATTTYPDGAVVLKRNAVIDSLFALRAKNCLYWAARRMVMVDSQLDAAMLRQKGATFSSREVILAKSLVEEMVDLIDPAAELVIVPDGTAVVRDDVTLDEALLRRRGAKLYILGDVTVPETGDCLDSLAYLAVRGDARVPQARAEQLQTVAAEITGKVKLARAKGSVVENKPYVTVTRWMLEQQPMGLEVSNCAVVTIAEDVPRELIVQHLHLSDCAQVRCTDIQRDAVELISEDVAQIGEDEPEKLPSLDTKVICASEYVL